MATTIQLLQFHPSRPHHLHLRRNKRAISIRAFNRSDVDRFARDTWRSANEGIEKLVFEARLAAQRIDRKYDVARRFDAAASAARMRAREIDAELGIARRWKDFSVDFERNLPRYRRQLNHFSKTPIGRGLGTLFFVWFFLSGWFFRIFFFATWVLPFAAPILLGAFANNFAIEVFAAHMDASFENRQQRRNILKRKRSCYEQGESSDMRADRATSTLQPTDLPSRDALGHVSNLFEDGQNNEVRSPEQIMSPTRQNHTRSRQPFNVGTPRNCCQYCGAYFWDREKHKKLSKKAMPVYTLCCHKGRVKLPMLVDPPPILNSLLAPMDSERSSHFREKLSTQLNFKKDDYLMFTLLYGLPLLTN